jgi:hypothetical protein
MRTRPGRAGAAGRLRGRARPGCEGVAISAPSYAMGLSTVRTALRSSPLVAVTTLRQLAPDAQVHPVVGRGAARHLIPRSRSDGLTPSARATRMIVERRGSRPARSSRLISVRCRSQAAPRASCDRCWRSRSVRRFRANLSRGSKARTLAMLGQKLYRQKLSYASYPPNGRQENSCRRYGQSQRCRASSSRLKRRTWGCA